MMLLILLFFVLSLDSIDAALLSKVNVKSLCLGTMLSPNSLRCIYVGSRDGFDAGKFHAKVDLGVPSLILASVKSGGGLLGIGAQDELIGGYNPFGFQSVNDYRPTRKAFVFAVKEGELFKCAKVGGADAAVFDFEDEGPVFGAEALRISLNARKNGDVKLVTSRLGSDYERLGGGTGGAGGISERRAMTVKDGNSLLSGSSKGSLVELEVYISS